MKDQQESVKDLNFLLVLSGSGNRKDWIGIYNQLGSTGETRVAFVSGGYKFGKLPSFILFGKTKMSHIMQGTYAKPICI